MHFAILTLFPSMFDGPLTESILKRAQQAGFIEIDIHNIRDYATDRHRTTDDAPYGGGAGMVMKAEPLAAALRAVRGSPLTDHPPEEQTSTLQPLVLLMSPDGEPLTQSMATELAQYPRIVLVCGHYEGIDERVRTTLIDREVSIGDYILTGGELAAMVLVDAVSRLVPGVLDPESLAEESFSDGLLEYPHYTRPAIWEGQAVPPVLLSGHHGQVALWRRQQRLQRTLMQRPDVLTRSARDGLLTADDLRFLISLGWQPPDR
ncbi:MAG: tRNA (guanosine(37)-N1)-methyltransferase TrmD [Chloroflexaceae bacterium]|nr:tRNA (guanosine(37)-N1)-methyltransferase TrmD [Chloroflexaceae bacterium]